MTVYYDLVKDEKPTMEVLMESWKPIKSKILDWRNTVNRPILFTEVGCPIRKAARRRPGITTLQTSRAR